MRREFWLKTAIFAVLLVFTDYFLPLLCAAQSQLLLLLLVYIPGLTFALSWFYGLVSGFSWPYPFAVAALFVPAALIYYNATALWFAPVYGLCAGLGCVFGSLWRKKS